MTLSRKAIDSLKMGPAITIAYSIALHMDWEQPRWAAINVALVGMFTVGLSLNNAIERILGTITAGLMTLTLLGLFGQDRWLYVLTLSIWMGICTYMMGGKKFEGYWMMAGCYLYFEPQKMLFKGLGIVLVLTLWNISNEQVYDFNSFIDTSVMFGIIAFTLQITAYIPFSSRPDNPGSAKLWEAWKCVSRKP